MTAPFRMLLAAALGALVAAQAQAAVQSRTVTYQDGDVTLTGHLYWDDAYSGERPGVMVLHEWWGLNDYARERARMLAELGYVAFAADMYGTGKVTEHGKQAKEWMSQITANVEDWRRRALLGLEQLRDDPRVDAERLAAIGYCFGGATVMQMAYGGADLDGVVSFHGSLPVPGDGVESIAPAVLVAHGNADSFVPPERVQAFQDAMEAHGADWQFVSYGGARHGFTNPGAGEYGIDALAYDPAADRRSWRAMQGFLDEIFLTR